MVRKCSSSAPQTCPNLVLLEGLNWWRSINGMTDEASQFGSGSPMACGDKVNGRNA
jgi:hypothetical protein